MGRRPSTFFGASGQFEAEMTDLANEVAQDVCQYQDWQGLIRLATITGDGTQTGFDLPTDYGRMLLNSDVQDTNNWAWGYHGFTDINEFLYFEERGFLGHPGGWIIYDNQLRFQPAPTAAATARFPYITKNYALDTSTAPKAAFTADTDNFVLPERLLTLGLVWRWRENKKLDATGDQEAFIKALDEYAVKDGGSRVQRRNAGRNYPGTHVAWPWTLG